MNKFLLGILAVILASGSMAQEVKKDEPTDKKIDWYETSQNSYVFIRKDSIRDDAAQAHLKTAIMAVNIPKAKDRQADPTKTMLNNDTELSYVTELTVNCTEKTSQIGSQFLYSAFFGKGELLQSDKANPNNPFVPLNGVDGQAIWEIVCQPKK